MTTEARRPARPAAARTAPAPGSALAGLPADYARFCEGVRALTGIDLGQYRPAQMERRLRSFAERNGAADLDAYLAELRRSPAALDAFLDRMTINVSELFRNPERFVELERDLLPALLRTAPSGLRVWSAGCSYGAEVYSLLIMLRELAPRARHDVLAADIDERVLARARAGVFAPSDMRNVSPERRSRWFTERRGAQGPEWQASAELRTAVSFSRMDLLRDPFPRGCHLIACRNVVIYFNDAAKDTLYRRFLEALAPGGLLFVGSTERINGAEEMGWEKAGTFFYRRPR
ncbi:MAG TPA: protein-glutamate O-methyltransferase CheR [Miltoncostaeaceae bacterium]|nr:protein-glutamate O-methyltransferase CheR [Miltoncostaeaceae bacterium]